MTNKLENVMNEMQRDLLKEYVNVFMGQAASMLSEMANQHVLLSVSEIELVNMSDEREAALFPHGYIVSSSMKFGHEFSGRAILLFPTQKAKLLVDACMGVENAAKTDSPLELNDSDFDVLKEISNVILNSVVGEFSNLMGTTIEFSVPNIDLVYISEKDQILFLKNSVYMLMLHTQFMLAEDEVDGMVIIALGMNSLNKLLGKIDEVLGEI
jgi:chemotaxis protein CheC